MQLKKFAVNAKIITNKMEMSNEFNIFFITVDPN